MNQERKKHGQWARIEANITERIKLLYEQHNVNVCLLMTIIGMHCKYGGKSVVEKLCKQ